MFNTIEIKDKKYLFLPYTQIIIDYDKNLINIAKDIKNNIVNSENHKELSNLFSEEINVKDKLEDAVYKYNSQQGIKLKACQVNVIHKCNLSCKYCFAGDGTHNKTARMTQETAKKTVDFIIKNKEKINY
ncbi:hypothetical protein EXQ42_16470 [Clostridium botulinum]|nr:hypothetical protein [Clostridium botulinum]MBO0576314.1 hypothetical protein [Clostridium botulinum]